MLQYYQYQAKTPDETRLLDILNLKGSESMNHIFPIPGLYEGRSLTPIHWAIFLDAPELVDRIASFSCVCLKAKVKGGLDPLQFCITLNRVRCFEELIPYLTTTYKQNQLISQVLRAPNSEFLEVMLRTIDPGITNANLEALARSARAPCRRIIADYIQQHPGDIRDQNLKMKSQTRSMVSLAPRNWRSDDDSDDSAYLADLEWLDYYDDKEWVMAYYFTHRPSDRY
jgi:hypothetical protein